MTIAMMRRSTQMLRSAWAGCLISVPMTSELPIDATIRWPCSCDTPIDACMADATFRTTRRTDDARRRIVMSVPENQFEPLHGCMIVTVHSEIFYFLYMYQAMATKSIGMAI